MEQWNSNLVSRCVVAIAVSSSSSSSSNSNGNGGGCGGGGGGGDSALLPDVFSAVVIFVIY